MFRCTNFFAQKPRALVKAGLTAPFTYYLHNRHNTLLRDATAWDTIQPLQCVRLGARFPALLFINIFGAVNERMVTELDHNHAGVDNENSAEAR